MKKLSISLSGWVIAVVKQLSHFIVRLSYSASLFAIADVF